MDKLLSIVIPTLNRANYIAPTLYAYKNQILRNLKNVELIICDNASTDNTINILESIYEEFPFFEIIKFSDCVVIGESISRAIFQAKSKYVLLWGDDDLPAPFMVDSLLYYIHKYPKAGLFHLNRLFGYDNLDSIECLTVQNSSYSSDVIIYPDLDKFISRYFLDTTFLSSIMFQRDLYKKDLSIDCSEHYGYEFLFPIYFGIKGKMCVYLNFPLCIQRQIFNRSWLNKSPLYRFVGMPNLIFDLQEYGLIKNARRLWMNTGNTKKCFWIVAPQISLYKHEYRPLCKEINRYQYSKIRKIYIYLFAYIFPSFIYKIIRSAYFNKKKKHLINT